MIFPFLKQNTADDPALVLRRIINRTFSAESLVNDQRQESRAARSFPLLFAPWTKKQVDLPNAGLAITQDVSDHGCSVLSLKKIESDIAFAFLLDVNEGPTDFVFHGIACRSKQVLPGLWQVGLRVPCILNRRFGRELEPFLDAVREAIQISSSAD